MLLRDTATGKLIRDTATGKLMREPVPEYGDDCLDCEPALWALGQTPLYVKMTVDNNDVWYLKQTDAYYCIWDVTLPGNIYAYWNIIATYGLSGSGKSVGGVPDYQDIGAPACRTSFAIDSIITWEITWGVGIGEAQYLAQ